MQPISPIDLQFWTAIEKQDFASAGALLSEGADPHLPDPDEKADGNSALSIASACGAVEFVKTLLAHGADPNQTSKSKQTSLHAAVIGKGLMGEESSQYIEIARLLIEAGAEVDAVDGDGFTPLMYAAKNHHIQLCRHLIGAGADPGWALHGKPATTTDKKLQQAGALGVFVLPVAQNPLHIAAKEGVTPVFELLVRAGGDLFLPNSEGKTPLEIVRKREHDPINELCDALCDKIPQLPEGLEKLSKAELLQKNADGYGVLDHPQTWQRMEDVLGALEECGEAFSKDELLAADEKGSCLLTMAVECRALKPMLKHLVRQGSPLKAADMCGADGEANLLAERMRDYLDLPDFIAHLKETATSTDAFRHNLRNLPQVIKNDIPLHQVLADMGRQSSQQPNR